jgi:hypothetical protein
LLAAGTVVLYLRKGSHHAWGDLTLLLLVAIPMLLLFALAAFDETDKESEHRDAWRSVLMVVAILLGPLVLAQLLRLLGASTANTFYMAGILVLTGLIAAYGAQVARVPYAALLAGLALLLAWLVVWGNLLDHPSANTFRVLLIVAAALLFLAAAWLWRAETIGAAEIATVGGVAAVAAGTLGVVVGTFAGTFGRISGIIESSGSAKTSASRLASTNGFQHFGWDLYLLVVSVALVWIGSRVRARGLGYVGGFGLLAFLISVGTQVTRIESGRLPSAALLGWPLALLVLGGAGLLAPALLRRDS